MYNEAGEELKPHGEVDGEEKNKHTEEGEGRRRLDEADWKKITVDLEKYRHPLNDQQPGVYNICNDQVAPYTVNVQNAIGIEQSRQFSASLSSEFHKTIKKKVKTTELLKNAVTVKGKAIYDVVTLFSRLLVVGQQRSVDIADAFQFELSPVPPALIDRYGCLRKGDKAVLVKSLSVSVITGDLAASFGTRLAHYPPVSKKIVLFDRYDQEAPSAKDHERTRRGRAKEVHLTPNTLPPSREVILHNSKNKNLLNNILCSYPLPHNIQLVNMLDCVVTHEETDVTLCSYMLKAVAAGAQAIRILSDDTDVFILLEYWTSRMRVVAKIQMEKWNGDILDINETVQRLGPKSAVNLSVSTHYQAAIQCHKSQRSSS